MTRELLDDNECTLLAWLRMATWLFALGCAIALCGSYLEQGARNGRGEAGPYCCGVVILIVAIFAVVLGVGEYHRRRVQLDRVLPLDEHQLRSRALWRLTALVALAGISMLMILVSLQ